MCNLLADKLPNLFLRWAYIYRSLSVHSSVGEFWLLSRVYVIVTVSSRCSLECPVVSDWSFNLHSVNLMMICFLSCAISMSYFVISAQSFSYFYWYAFILSHCRKYGMALLHIFVEVICNMYFPRLVHWPVLFSTPVCSSWGIICFIRSNLSFVIVSLYMLLVHIL